MKPGIDEVLFYIYGVKPLKPFERERLEDIVRYKKYDYDRKTNGPQRKFRTTNVSNQKEKVYE